MIPYVEIIDKTSLKPLAPIEPSECWFEMSYYEVGEFELYCVATTRNLSVLQKGNYVKIPNKRFLWLITSIEYSFTADQKTRVVIAKGKEAKFLLNKRIIKKPIELNTDLISVVSYLFQKNIGTESGDDRQIPNFALASLDAGVSIGTIQATRENLLDFTLNLLKTYKFGSISTLEGGTIYFKPYKGIDRSNSIKFSQSFDNLLSSTYYSSDEDFKTYALIVSTIDEVDYEEEYNSNSELKGVDRNEILVSSNLSTKYNDSNGNEQETTPTSSLYKSWQREEGKTKLTEHLIVEEVNGEIDLTNSIYMFDKDFFLGDLVTVRDEYFDFSFKARILKITISQDKESYKEEFDYSVEK